MNIVPNFGCIEQIVQFDLKFLHFKIQAPSSELTFVNNQIISAMNVLETDFYSLRSYCFPFFLEENLISVFFLFVNANAVSVMHVSLISNVFMDPEVLIFHIIALVTITLEIRRLIITGVTWSSRFSIANLIPDLKTSIYHRSFNKNIESSHSETN